MGRIKSLDGMRAVSIIFVLLGHLSETLPQVITKSKFYPFLLTNGGVFSDGRLGVNIFFVISGYLITKLLIIEKEKTGSINLKYFFLRRILRILPVFYLYILVLVFLKIFFIPTLFDNYTLAGVAALYLWNYAHLFNINASITDHGYWFFGHFWSLSLEEQFYLVWPIMLIKINNSIIKKVVIGIIVIIPFIRIATYFLMSDSRGQLNMMLQTGGNAVFIGCLGALLENTTFFKERIVKIIYNKGLIAIIAVFLLVIAHLLYMAFRGFYTVPLGTTLGSLGIMIILYWVMNVPSKVSDFLNNKIIVEIGVLSYSLYVWQQLFLTTKINYWFTQFPQNIFLVFAAALTSYYVIEKPILRLKTRLKRI